MIVCIFTMKYTRLSIRTITHTRGKCLNCPVLVFRASHLGLIPSKDCVAAWALMSDVLEIVHAEGNAHAAPETCGYQASARSARARRACALRALGLLLADGTPTVGGGKTF